MEEAIRSSMLTKRFGSVTAVNGLDLLVKKGTIFGLVGPDGAGKTTTIRMLCGILLPDEGEAFVGGYNTVAQGERLKEYIGYMPQRFSLYGDLTVMENLEFYAEIYQVPRQVRREKIKKLLAFSNLTAHVGKLADQLSGGMKQKLALSCNLIHTPAYLFLDEPTTGVDPVARREFWKILFGLKNQGTTIFVSTPYMDEAERCDEVGLMYNGNIMRLDKPENMIMGFERELLSVSVDNIFKARDYAGELPYVEDVYIYGEELHIIADDFKYARDRLVLDFKDKKITTFDIKKISPSLEDVFITSVREMKKGIGGKQGD
ncbi:ABC transporter ATP-binding protein [Biomaibacter acetigenes]|uniref:ABC transporter ATP-binding protein n=1 Tax=Biomaibacter acetigenes TaxID=2316383 RepID=A0A3G2R8R8_9FIRM|nr:ABC transporter ATP-binding protein [Biomaibacter acetigenes]AYO31934.1 ABC transporter ATP-binding protein [Biomaibacter acetigenes]